MFLLSCIYVAKNPAHLCGTGILISFVKLWCFMDQTLQGYSIKKPPSLRGKQILKIIIYDNFEYLHSYLRKIFSIDFPFASSSISLSSWRIRFMVDSSIS